MFYYRNNHQCFDINEVTEKIEHWSIKDLKGTEEEKGKILSKYIEFGESCYGNYRRNIVRNIAFIELEENTLEKIQFKIVEYNVISNRRYDIESIVRKKNLRYFVIDVKNKSFKIKNARSEYTYPINQGFCTMKELFISKLFSVKTSMVIYKDSKCFEKILNNISSEKSLSYIKEMNDMVRNKSYNSEGYNSEIIDILHGSKSWYTMTGMTSLFCKKISILNYYIGNPGIEAIMKNDLFVNQVIDKFILRDIVLPQGNLAEVLGISKTGLKTTNYIVKAFVDNISKTSLSLTAVDELEIKKIISSIISNDIKTFDRFTSMVKGFNNVTDFIFKWSEEYFFQLYYLRLNRNRYYGDIQKRFAQTIKEVMHELDDAILEITRLINQHDVYQKNIPLLFDYVTKLMRKQGYTCLKEGVKMLNDYCTMCKKINAPFDKYPKHLRTSHDIVMMNYYFYEASKSELDSDGFANAVKAYQHLEWNKKSNKFAILTPASYNELFIEGCSLDHCVSSYISKVIDGTSRILFIRESDAISKPFFTMELVDNVINHVKGAHQCDADEEVRGFIFQWAKKFDLVCNY